MARRYRVKAQCRKCGKVWTTRAKKDASAPNRCTRCGSTKVGTIHAWRVNV